MLDLLFDIVPKSHNMNERVSHLSTVEGGHQCLTLLIQSAGFIAKDLPDGKDVRTAMINIFSLLVIVAHNWNTITNVTGI